MIFRRVFLSCWLGLSILLCLSAQAEEFIRNYQVNITIEESAELAIEEIIEVQSEQLQIRRGIYRDFPTLYTNRLGDSVRTTFDIEAVERDGNPEDHHTKKQENGIRLYIGNANKILPAGLHTFRIKFRTNRQLGYFDNHDELYFNAIGHGWDFPIKNGTVTVKLPPGLDSIKVTTDGFTGYQGNHGKFFRQGKSSDQVYFDLTRELKPNQGFTIVVGWPKGYVFEPDFLTHIQYFLADNFDLLLMMAGIFGVFLYYWRAWNKVGRDPDAGTIIPLFGPPDNLSPATLRFLRERSMDYDCFASALISLAVQGFIRIHDGTNYSVQRLKPYDGLSSAEESALMRYMFLEGDTFTFKKSNHAEIAVLKNQVEKKLSEKHENRDFMLNRGYTYLGFSMSFALVLVTFFASAICLNEFFRISMILLLVILGLLNLLMLELLEAPTLEGRKLLDQIEGFRMYLSTAEKETLGLIDVPEETVDLFEKYLPYAIALSVEHEWSERFAKQIAALAATQGGKYSPDWHTGSSFRSGSDFASSVSHSLSSSIASAATPPGSSSGGGGGGSSGGGGGGGGGGGW